MTEESVIKKDIHTYLTKKGFKVHRMNSGLVKVKGGWMRACEAGTPDLLVFGTNKYVLWIEVKKPGEDPTDIQEEKMSYYKALGHKVLVARSLKDVLLYLK